MGAYQLVVAEKPSVARSIAEVIGANTNKHGYIEGNGYIVTWCIGHLVTLSSPEDYGDKYSGKWNFSQLPIIPDKWRFSNIEGTTSQLKVIKDLMNRSDVSEIICATDAGREGEAIFRYVYNKIGCKKPFKRLWISSMENKAISNGFKNLRNGKDYDNIYRSGLCRAKADWLVGMNGTRLFTCRYGSMISIGRVQTPTLALVVQRDYDVEHFVKQKYFTVDLKCGDFTACSERIDNENTANAIVSECNGAAAEILNVKRETKSVNPPAIYDLTTLQREANRRYGYTAQETLDYTQYLYEKKLVTYPRTDSQYLTEEMEDTANEIIDTVYTVYPHFKSEIFSPDIRRCINNEKVSDHHAIIPTKELTEKELSALPAGEKNILGLIASRLIISTAPVYKYEAVKVTVSCGGTEFTSSGNTVIQSGWKGIEAKIFGNGKISEKTMPAVNNGDRLNVSAALSEHFTSPPNPYTEDTLLAAMERAGNNSYDSDTEKKGLGTPATRAGILENLVKRGYLVREKKQIISTETGRKIIEAVPEEIKSPKLTADWESKLQAIENGTYSDTDFINNIESFVEDLCSKYSSVAEDVSFSKSAAKPLGKCPNCGKDILNGKYGFYCTGKCGIQVSKIYGKAISEEQLKNLLSGNKITFNTGRKNISVLPEIEPYSYNGKNGYQWKTSK